MRLPRSLAGYVRHGFLDDLSEPGPHEPRISEIFDRQLTPDPGRALDCRLTVMAFTNRCGSNLLADYLVQTSRFGGFGESLNAPVVQSFRDREKVRSLPDYLAALAEKHRCGGKRDLGVKASADQLAMLIRHGIPRMFAGFRVVHIWRQDLLGQAVSFVIANQTNRWTSRQAANERPIDAMAMDPLQIEHMMRAIQQQNNRIVAIISSLGIPGPSLSYEELTFAPAIAIRRVCRALEVDLEDWRPRAPKIQKQGDTLNQRLVAEYREVAKARFAR